MAQWNFMQFQSEIQKKNIVPVYFLYGDQPYLLDEALKSLSDVIFQNQPKDFNSNVFYADETSVLKVQDVVKTLPVASQKRMVVLKDAGKLKQIDDLLPLIEKPVSSCVLVFIDHQIDQRRKFFKLLAKHGVLVNCSSLKEAHLPAWLQRVASRLGKQVDVKTCYLLLEMVGPSMLDLHNEMMKLVQFIGSRQQITAEDVKQVASKQNLESVFDLVGALGSYRALHSLNALLRQGQSEVGLLAMLSRQIRILILLKEAQNQKMSSASMSRLAGISPYFLKSYLQQGRSWSFKQLQEFHGLLLKTDMMLKSSPLSKSLLLEACVLKASQIRTS